MGAELDTIISKLEGLGYPMEHIQFKDSKQNPAPPPPFIIWFTTENIRGADIYNSTKRTVICETNGSIELYTDIAEDAKETRAQIVGRIKAEVLIDVDFTEFETTIQAENMHQNAFEFKIVEKRRLGQ